MSATCLSKYPSVSLIAAGRGSVGGRIAHHLDTEGDHSDSCGMDLSYFYLSDGTIWPGGTNEIYFLLKCIQRES